MVKKITLEKVKRKRIKSEVMTIRIDVDEVDFIRKNDIDRRKLITSALIQLGYKKSD